MNLFLNPLFAEATTRLEPLPAAPVRLFSLFGFEINNSMIEETIAALVVIVLVQIAMRSPKLVPSGMQNFFEWLVETLANFVASITGQETARRGFWFFGGLFYFLFVENVLALLPGTASIGYGHGEGWDFKVDQPFFRGANANVNVTAAYAAIFFVMWFYWCFRSLGAGGVANDLFGSKVKFNNTALNIGFALLFFVVGLIEVFTIIGIRPVAFTFRLYGNIYGGETFLDSIYHTAPNHFWATLFLIPAYMWEFVVAFIQAFVFFILTVVFTGILTNAHAQAGDEHGAEADHKDKH
jgi:F-type H+-transporting ATPase subunit a